MRIARLALAVTVSLWLPASARAGILFFVNDEPGFASAIAGSTLMGTEDWSSAGNAPAAAVPDPLQPGIANGVFPNGVNPATGLTVQSNDDSSSGGQVAPGSGLYYSPAGSPGFSGNIQPSNQLSPNLAGDSFDLIFANVGDAAPTAVSFSAMYYRLGFSDIGAPAVLVFDADNNLLGSTSVPNVADVLEDSFLGIQITGGDTLGRVNLWAGELDVAGADNIAVYAPEASGTANGAMTAAAFLALAAARGRAPSRLRSWITSDGASASTVASSEGA